MPDPREKQQGEIMQLPFSTNKPSTPAPEGAHPARLVRILDLGTHVTPFVHEDGSPVVSRKLSIAWELYTDPRMDDGRPFMVSERYTRSLNSKAILYQLLSGWLGKEFDKAREDGTFNLESLLGRPCLVSVNHKTSKKGQVFASIGSVTVIPKALVSSIDAQVNPSVMFDLDKFDKAIYDNLPGWQREEIAKSPEYAEIHARAHNPEGDPDIPF
jgi:hypothetical protein